MTVQERHRFPFGGKLAVLGGGSVSQCLQPMLRQHVDMNFSRLTVIDMDPGARISPELAGAGARFEQLQLTPANLAPALARIAGQGGLVVNLTTDIGTGDIVNACQDIGALYLDASVEVWDTYARQSDPRQGTLYARWQALNECTRHWGARARTALVDQGANPGLVSLWLRRGLTDLATAMLKGGEMGPDRERRIERALEDAYWACVARELDVKVIQCAERDTQVSTRPRLPGWFLNTWSVPGFREEALWSPVEIGWGTHETDLPAGAQTHQHGPRNQILLPQRLGADTWVRSWVPTYGTIHGMAVRHGENYTISNALTVLDETGRVIYRPTTFYAYWACDAALASLQECRAGDYQLQDNYRVMTDEIDTGRDELGALILGGPLGWWCGSSLSIGRSRALVPGQNATTLQVAASIIGGIGWILEHPNQGLCTPEDVAARDHETVLEVADPYLGDCLSLPTDWTPLANRAAFPLAALSPRPADPWQFGSFLVN